MKSKLLSIAAALLLSMSCFAQLDINPFPASSNGFSITSLTDYQSLYVNPANLGYMGDHKVHFGLADVSFGYYSEPLSRSQIANDFFASNFSFSEADRTEAAKSFTDSRILAGGTANLLGFAYQDEKIGGFALTIRERISFNLIFNEFTSNMLFHGWNMDYFDQKVRDANGAIIKGESSDPKKLSVLGNGSEVDLSWTREYVFGYGYSLVNNKDMQLNLGLSVRYIQGFAMVQYFTFDNGADQYFRIATAPIFNADLGPNTLSPVDGTGLNPVGKGFGLDFGLSASFGGKARFGIALSDLGKINWFGNVFTGANVPFTDIESAGINSYNLFSEAGKIEGIAGFDYENISPMDQKLPMNLKLGGSYKVSEIVELGAEAYFPIIKDVAGAFHQPILSCGAILNFGIINIHGGLNYNEFYGLTTPFSAVFKLGKEFQWELGLGSRDVAGLFQQTNPGMSLVVGLIRIGI